MGAEDKLMRIDKWLWSVRLFKSRSIAAEACKSNKVFVNGSLVKPSRDIKVGDTVSVKKMPVIYSFRALASIKTRVGAKDVPTYMENITPQSELDKLLANLTLHLKRDRGTGRPTKKERREIDDLMEDFFDSEDDE